MNSKSGKSQRIHHNYTKIYLLTVLLCVIAAVVGGLLFLHFSNIQAPAAEQPTADKTGAPTSSAAKTESPTAEPTPDKTETPDNKTETPAPSGVERLTLTDSDFKTATPLSLINKEHPYTGKVPIGIANIYDDRKTKDYKLDILNTNVALKKAALAALIDLNAALIEEYPNYRLLILSGYTTDMYSTSCKAIDKDQPSYDEHVTGFAFDCRYIVKMDDGKEAGVQLADAAAAAQTGFLLQKAADLGFIQSKAKLTGHTSSDMRHIRYVGVPHAGFIYENGLSLEDYLEYLKDYNFNKRLTLTDAEGNSYEVYYVKATEGETTVNVPKDSNYTVLSDNAEGYVVTIKLG